MEIGSVILNPEDTFDVKVLKAELNNLDEDLKGISINTLYDILRKAEM